jgi:competence protein ComEC
LREQHLFWVIHVKAEQVEIGKRHRFSVLGMGDGIRQRLVRRFSERYSVRAAGLLSGMLLGDRRAILPADAATLSAIGLGHLLAISGLHVTVLVASWLWLMRKFKMLRVVRYGLTYGLLALFVVVTGASIPVVRAAISGAIGLFFAYQRRWRDAQSIIAATGLVMLLWDPYILLSVSYQLSFAVTFGIVTACPVMVGWLPKRWPVWVRAAVAVSLVAQLFSLPFQLRVFNELSLFAIPVNLVFVPFITYVITPLGYFSLGLPLASITEPLLLGFVDFCAGLNAWLVARTIWASPSWWWIAGYFGVLVMLFYDFPKTFVRRLGVAAFVGMLVVANFPPMSEGQVYVEVLDVGQGDAILLHLPNHRYWLMDGGGAIDFANNTGTWKQKLKPFDPGADVLVPLLKQRGVRELDAVVMSHANEDHVLGLQALVARIPVRHVLFNGTINGSVKIRGLYEQLLKRHIPMLRVQAGDVFPIGNGGRIVVLNPPRENGVPFFTPDQNKMSVVLLLQLYGQSLLLTGDLDSHADAQVVQEAKALGVLKAPLSVLKVSHHGSKYASSVPFLAMWRPRVAVISVGKWNRYGHPHRDTLARLARIGANVLRTDQAGAVHVTIRPSGIHVYTKKVWQNLP